MPRYLHPDLSIDHTAIDAAAVKAADHAMTRQTPGSHTTWQRAYDDAQARYLDLAKVYRSTELWRLERDAALETMSPREIRILELREAAHLGRMIDDTREAIAVQDAAEAELAKLLAEAA